MRCYQEMGLKPEAKEWINEHCLREDDFCPTCGQMGYHKLKVLREEHLDLFYGEGPYLPTYVTEDNGEVSVVLQAEPWSSGPVAFLCLELDGKRMFEWSSKEIAQYS